MQFVVNNEPVNVEPVDVDTTLLRYLRTQRKLTGTKEGCASGDCGACTVLVGSDEVGFKAVNSCICPLGTLENQRVITVEGLSESAGKESEMHPVQEAIVDCHGSQCGFCTPGFVMSLAALHLSEKRQAAEDETAQRARVVDAISGNLCRCTGYRPIVEAGIQALKKPVQPINIVQKWGIGAPLAGTPVLQKDSQAYWQPRTETELQALLRDHPDARLIAGGTDLMLEVTQLYKSLPKLIDLSRAEGLADIQVTTDALDIGSAATYCQLEAALTELSPAFVALLHRLGSRQIRNRGTLGGNIGNASPIADTPPALMVLDADLLIGNSEGEYRKESLADFYLGYKRTTLAAGEYIARIRVQRGALQQPLRLYKVSKRYEDDISAVMGAFLHDENGGLRVAFGGMAAVPRRAIATENLLNTQPWLRNGKPDEHLLAQACEELKKEFSPLTDVRASAEYRLAIACNLLVKACHSFAAQAAGVVTGEGVFDHA